MAHQVRSAASRLLGQKLSDIGAPDALWTDAEASGWIADANVLRRVANRLCNQWTSEHLDKQLGEQVAKNVVWIATAYLAAPEVAAEAEAAAAEEPDVEDAEDGMCHLVQRSLSAAHHRLLLSPLPAYCPLLSLRHSHYPHHHPSLVTP